MIQPCDGFIGMTSAWMWQGTTEAPTHCVFHYPSAPPVTIPPPPCYSHVSSDTYNFPATYGFASVAPPYPAFSTQCVRLTFVRKPGVLCEQPRTDESHTVAKYQVTAQPPGPGPGPGPAPRSASGAASGPVPAPSPSQILTQAPTLILVSSSSAGMKPPASLPEQECDNELDKSLFRHAKRLCRIRPRPRLSQHAPAEQTVRRMPPLRTGLSQRRMQECGVQDRWVVWTRPRRVTKRVSGVKTPHPYQRRRKSLIQRHLLQIPGESVCLPQSRLSLTTICVLHGC